MVNLAALRVGPVRYNSPTTQIVILSIVVFCTVGLFSAIGYLGAGGTQDVSLSDTANGVLYGTFAIGGLFAGAICNMLGVRLTLFIGSLGYALYVGGLWAFQVHGTRWFLILAGGILGFCASLLWSAQGALMMSLPMEKDKGRAFSLFWIIFQSGALVGAIIALALTVRNGTVAALGTGIYLAFIIIMFVGSAMCWLILPPTKVIRNDGSIVEIQAAATVKQEIHGMWLAMKRWEIWLLIPAFFASNYFYAYQGAITARTFNGRTRALTAVLSALGSMTGALVMGTLLDKAPFKTRKLRGYLGVTLAIVAWFAIWGSGLAYQLTFTRADPLPNLDWSDKAAGPPLALICFYYYFDASLQALIYYLMGCLSSSPYELARYAGLYKAVQSAGAAGSFGMDAVKTPYLNELLASALICIVALPLMYIVLRSVRDTPEDEMLHVEDVNSLGSDLALPPGHHLGRATSSMTDEKKQVQYIA